MLDTARSDLDYMHRNNNKKSALPIFQFFRLSGQIWDAQASAHVQDLTTLAQTSCTIGMLILCSLHPCYNLKQFSHEPLSEMYLSHAVICSEIRAVAW